jgi:hypothetical protein
MPSCGDYFLSKIPQDLYGPEPVDDEDATVAASTSCINADGPIFDDTQVDDYGWVCVDEGKWYNVFSTSYADERPY